jgi:hypothetical protein
MGEHGTYSFIFLTKADKLDAIAFSRIARFGVERRHPFVWMAKTGRGLKNDFSEWTNPERLGYTHIPVRSGYALARPQ